MRVGIYVGSPEHTAVLTQHSLIPPAEKVLHEYIRVSFAGTGTRFVASSHGHSFTRY